MSKIKYLSLLGVLFMSALLGAASLTSGHNWAYGDFASYIMQAQSILDGNTAGFIEHNSITVFQSDVQVGPVAYPWGYPLLLVPVLAMLGLSTLGMKLLNVIFYIGFLVTLFILFYRRLSFSDNLMILALFAVNPVFLAFENFILSDISFLFFSTLTILLIGQWPIFFPEKHLWKKRILVGIGAFLAFLIRTNGLLLLLTLFVYDGILAYVNRDKFKSSKERFLELSAPYFVFSVLWTLFSLVFPDGQNSHFSHYDYQTVSRSIENLTYYFGLGRDFFSPLPYAQVTYYLFVILFFIGILNRYQDDLIFVIYFLLTYALYISWPDRQGVRFLFPVLPLFIYFAWQGLKQLTVRLSARIQMGILAFVWLLVFTPFLFSSGQGAIKTISNRGDRQGPFREVSLEMFDYVEKNTPEDSVIVFYKPRIMRLMTERDAILITSCEHLVRGDYFVFSEEAQSSGQLSGNDLASCDVPLETLFANRKFVVYQINTD